MAAQLITGRRVIFLLLLIALIAAGVFFWIRSRDPLYAQPRRDWKNQAIADIEKRLADQAWFEEEFRRARGQAYMNRGDGGWAQPNMIVFKNGQWMVCDNFCRKRDPRIEDIFIGRGSDGQWYYSTFHFCGNLCVLSTENQPPSLAWFVDGYHLRPFDGRSDECLKKTCTSEPYGEGKLGPLPHDAAR